MQALSIDVSQTIAKRGGGRVASPAYRQSLAVCEDFMGLEESVNRYDLLLLVKRVGKLARFTPRMIQLLDYYMAFTTEADWERGSRPIVYQSLSKTSLDLGVSERQIQKLEQQLFEAGAITWNDSGNHKRYGQRDRETGRILYAFGVDLTPLAYLRSELEDRLHQKQLYDKAWLETKREISWARRQIRSLLLEWREEGAELSIVQPLEDRYDEIAIQIRTHLGLQELRTLLERHRDLHSRLLENVEANSTKPSNCPQGFTKAEETEKSSCVSEPEIVHYKYKTHESNNCSLADQGFQESVDKPTEPNDLVLATGLQHVSLKQALLAAGEPFRDRLPLESRPVNWNDMVEAAYQLRAELGISQRHWGEACETLGRAGAAVSVLITDRAMRRAVNPVLQPAAYFRGMINKSRAGELRLHSAIFGLLDREGKGI